MSVTVKDLLNLPSLRQAKVLGGAKGLSRVVASISVLESIDPGVLINEVFPQGKFYGSEIVLTGFLNCADDVDCQCANILRLAQGGEVGLILFYVGVYLQKVDQRLIDLADQLDFVLIAMPEGQRELRYSDLISDVTEYIYRDRAQSGSLVSDCLARMSTLPRHQQTVGTIMQMLCTELSCSVALRDEHGNILNMAAWPHGQEKLIREGLEQEVQPLQTQRTACTFLTDTEVCRMPIHTDSGMNLELLLIKGSPFLSDMVLAQAADVTRICINIWGRGQGTVAIHELIRAILQDEPLKMRRLAEIFHVDIASIHELWMISGTESQVEPCLQLARQCAKTVVGAFYEDGIVLCLSVPASLREAETVTEEILDELGTDTVVVRCGGLRDTTECRAAYLVVQDHLNDARKIYLLKRSFSLGELRFAQKCRQQAEQGESVAAARIKALTMLQRDKEEMDLAGTLCTYLLDAEASVTKTASLLYLHKNTVKYRIQRLSNLLGFRPGKLPETTELYEAVGIYRLLH